MSDEQGGPDAARRRGRRAAPKRSRLAVLSSGARSFSTAIGGRTAALVAMIGARLRALLTAVGRTPLAVRARPRLATAAGWVAAHRQPVLIGAAALVSVGMIGGTMAVAGLAAGGADADARQREAAGVEREASVESVPGRATPNSPPDPVPHRDAPAPGAPSEPAPAPSPDDASEPQPDADEPVVPPPTDDAVVVPEDDHPGRGKGPKWER
ncbi:hypothetical protein ACWKWP_16470 [Agromyces soli]